MEEKSVIEKYRRNSFVRINFTSMTTREMAAALCVSIWTVLEIMKDLNLHTRPKVIQPEKVKMVRPKAVYSNLRLYEPLIPR